MPPPFMLNASILQNFLQGGGEATPATIDQITEPPPTTTRSPDDMGPPDEYQQIRKKLIEQMLHLTENPPQAQQKPSRISWKEAFAMALNPDLTQEIMARHRPPSPEDQENRQYQQFNMVKGALGALPEPAGLGEGPSPWAGTEGRYIWDPRQGKLVPTPGMPPGAGPKPAAWGGTQGRKMWDPEQGKVVDVPGMEGEGASIPELVWGRFLDEGINPVDPGHPQYEKLQRVAEARARAKGRKVDETLNREIRQLWRNAYSSSSLLGPDRAQKAAEDAIGAYQGRFGAGSQPPTPGAGPVPPGGPAGPTAPTGGTPDPAPYIPPRSAGAMTDEQALEEMIRRGIPEAQAFEILYQKGY